MDLSTLRRQGEGLARALARCERDRLRGASPTADLPGIFAPYSALASPEAVACAREELEHAPKESKSAARAALDLAATAAQAARAAPLDAECLAFGSSAKVVVDGESIPLRELPRRVANEPDRERRARLGLAFDRTLARLDRTLSHRVDEWLELASELGFASFEALRAEASGVDFASLAREAQATLDATEDAWRDLFDFGLRRMVGNLGLAPRGEAAVHDWTRFSRLARLDDLFKPQRLLAAAQAFLEAMGLSASAGGRIDVDAEESGDRPPGAEALALQVPDEIAIVLGRMGGAADYAALWHALGVAHHLAAASPELPVEHRRAGDLAGREAFGFLFDTVLCDVGFLKRALDADAREAQEAARQVAIARLGRLRLACADFLYRRTLFAEGPREDLRGLYRELHLRAVAVDWPVERWLTDLRADATAETQLRALALSEAMRRALLHQANEDWWRNPRSSGLLKRTAACGGRDAAEATAKELGGALSLGDAAAHLVAVAAR